MNRRDRKLWASARSLADVGALTVRWLNGEMKQTPGHCGPPCAETIPHIGVLSAVNRAGFVTTNSQSAAVASWGTCEAWVAGLVSDGTLQRIQAEVIANPPLRLAGATGRQRFGESPLDLRAAWRDDTGFYADRCPHAADEIRDTWFITITDPEPGRNSELWRALAAFADPRCHRCGRLLGRAS